MKHFLLLTTLSCFAFFSSLHAQEASKEQLMFYTQEWQGERFFNGRPKVSDEFLERIKYVTLEEAWGTIRGEGYYNKYEGDWKILYPDKPIIGRALTATFLPSSPELKNRMTERGRKKGEEGPMLIWPINKLVKGDVYVANSYGKVKGGPIIGDNYAKAIYANSGNGVVFYGSSRDLKGLQEIEGFNAFVKAWHPSANDEMMLIGINTPTRIGEAVVLPGDVVLAGEGGVIFIPPHLVEKVIVSSEVTRIKDAFRKERIEAGKYTLDEVYTSEWTVAIKDDFYGWVENNRVRINNQYGVGFDTIDKMIGEQSMNWQEWLES